MTATNSNPKPEAVVEFEKSAYETPSLVVIGKAIELTGFESGGIHHDGSSDQTMRWKQG